MQRRWLENITDFDLSIAYTPGKANVMADALSRKSYCNNLMIEEGQPALYEEFQKLNLNLVPQGFLAHLVAEPTLDHKIRVEQTNEDARGLCDRHASRPAPPSPSSAAPRWCAGPGGSAGPDGPD